MDELRAGAAERAGVVRRGAAAAAAATPDGPRGVRRAGAAALIGADHVDVGGGIVGVDAGVGVRAAQLRDLRREREHGGDLARAGVRGRGRRRCERHQLHRGLLLPCAAGRRGGRSGRRRQRRIARAGRARAALLGGEQRGGGGAVSVSSAVAQAARGGQARQRIRGRRQRGVGGRRRVGGVAKRRRRREGASGRRVGHRRAVRRRQHEV